MGVNTEESPASKPATRNCCGLFGWRRRKYDYYEKTQEQVRADREADDQKMLTNTRLWGMEHYRDKIRAAADLLSQDGVHSSSEHMAQVEALLDDADRVRNIARRVAEGSAFAQMVDMWFYRDRYYEDHYCYDGLDGADRRLLSVVVEEPSSLVR